MSDPDFNTARPAPDFSTARPAPDCATARPFRAAPWLIAAAALAVGALISGVATYQLTAATPEPRSDFTRFVDQRGGSSLREATCLYVMATAPHAYAVRQMCADMRKEGWTKCAPYELRLGPEALALIGMREGGI